MVRPLNVGAGRGGSTGELASAVEVVENAGDTARSELPVGMPDPSSATAAGGGDEGNEDVVRLFSVGGFVRSF